MHTTLYNLPDLRTSHFGRPPPRHGLNLLWWFVHHCIWIDSNGQMIAECDPANGAFGFHRFFNREGLLPRANLMYYVVGNLNYRSLPDYVTENYKGRSDISNSDRIIASYDSKSNRFDRIYVTRHSDLRNFDQNHTHRITTDLLKLIKGMSRKQFLREILNESEYNASYPEILPSTIINTPRYETHDFSQLIKGMSQEVFLSEILNYDSENHPSSSIKTQPEPTLVESVQEMSQNESKNHRSVSVINMPQSMEIEPVRRRSSCPSNDACVCAKFCFVMFGVIGLLLMIIAFLKDIKIINM